MLLLFDFPDIDSTAVVLYLSLSLLTVVLNALVIITIWKDPFKDLKGIPNYIILNLAVSDLLVGISAELLIALLHWCPYEGVLRAVQVTDTLGFSASSLTIMGLAVERLIVISYPSKSADYLTYTNLTFGILCIWLYAGLRAFIPELEWNSINRNEMIISDSLSNLTFTVTVFCYVRIFFLVRKGSSHRNLTTEAGCGERQCLTENAREREKIKRSERSVMCCGAILVGLLIVCWTPWFIVGNIGLSCGKSCVIPYPLTFIANTLIHLHPLVDPIAYALCTRKFRRAVKKIICKSCKCNVAFSR